jgi:hypothetical protein
LENCRDVTGFVSELSLLTKKLVPLAKRIDKPVDVGIHEEIGYSLSDIGWDKYRHSLQETEYSISVLTNCLVWVG